LNNLAPRDATELDARVIAELGKVRENQAFLRSLFRFSALLARIFSELPLN
jgi:hypothetical protein